MVVSHLGNGSTNPRICRAGLTKREDKTHDVHFAQVVDGLVLVALVPATLYFVLDDGASLIGWRVGEVADDTGEHGPERRAIVRCFARRLFRWQKNSIVDIVSGRIVAR